MRPQAEFIYLVAEPTDQGSRCILRLALARGAFLSQALGGCFSEQLFAPLSARIKIKLYWIH